MRLFFFTAALLGAVVVCGQDLISRIPGSPYPVTNQPDTLFVFEETGHTKSELLAATTLQGLQARVQPQIYCDYGKGSHVFLSEFEKDNVIIDYRFRRDIRTLLKHFQQDYKGYVLCDLEGEELSAAISLCGIKDAIAVTTSLKPFMDSLGKTMLEDARLLTDREVYNRYKTVFSKKVLVYQDVAKPTFLSGYSVFSRAFYFDEPISDTFIQTVFKDMDAHSVMLGWGIVSILRYVQLLHMRSTFYLRIGYAI